MKNDSNKFKIILPFCRNFTVLALFFLLGVAISSVFVFSFNALLTAIILLSLLFSVFINFILKNYWFYVFSSCLIALFVGSSYYWFFNQKYSNQIPYDQKMKIVGQIVQKPEVDYRQQKVIIEIKDAKINNLNIDNLNNTRLLVKLPRYPAVEFGDRLLLNEKIAEPKKIEDFDYEKYLRRYLIFGVVTASEFEELPTSLSSFDILKKNLYKIPDNFESSLNKSLPEPNSSLAAGIILGSKRNLPDTFKDELSATSLTHIVALSGFNITIIVTIIAGIAIGYLGRKKVFWFCLVLVIMFVFITGVSSSALRAAIFSMMIIFGRTLGRNGDMTNLSLLAAIIMVLINPYILVYDVGFQLSFLAFGGLLYLSPVIRTILNKRAKIIPEWIRSIFSETLGAQIAVMPIILATFGTISLIGPIANFVVVWIVPFAMLGSFVTGLLGLIWLPLGKMSIIFSWPLLEYVVQMTKAFAHIPYSSIQINNSGIIVELILYALIVIFIYLSAKKYKLNLIH